MATLVLLLAGWCLTFVMLADCMRRKRERFWYYVLLIPGPLGGLLYLFYDPAPVELPWLRRARLAAAGHLCVRCRRELPRGVKLCAMCQAESRLQSIDTLRVADL